MQAREWQPGNETGVRSRRASPGTAVNGWKRVGSGVAVCEVRVQKRISRGWGVPWRTLRPGTAHQASADAACSNGRDAVHGGCV